MMEELCELGEKLRTEKGDGEVSHDALKKEPVSIDIVIEKDGSFLKFEIHEKIMTIAEAITAKKGKARLLLDKAEEVLCYGDELSKKKHLLFTEKLLKYSDVEELKSVLDFYGSNKEKGINKASQEFEISIPDEKNRKGNLCFRINGSSIRIHEEDNILHKIIEKYEEEQRNLLAKSNRLCSVCGTAKYPVEDIPHGMIKKVPDGQSSGCALVSYNENAYESYELEGNNNSSICTNCAKKYIEALNWLLSSGNEINVVDEKNKSKKYFKYTNRKKCGSDTAVVFWTRKNENIQEIDYLEEPNPEKVIQLINSVSAGSKKRKSIH